jgi:two-component system invasion response regulator UvrY
MINVMLVDDHGLVRTGIKRILEDIQGIDVVAEAENGEQAIKQVRSKQPDVVLMDVSMPGIGGLEATRRITRSSPKTRVIAVTVHGESPYPSQLLEAGAAGYITKGCDVSEIISAIKSVHTGNQYITRDIAQKLALNFIQHGDRPLLETLTQRELQVMLMVAQGIGNKEISAQLCLSPKTTSTYRYRLYEKLGVDNDVELTRLAIRYGLVEETALH